MDGFFAFSLSQQGMTHVDRGVVCQDYSDTFSDERSAVIAVSDGHGSENFVRSDRGSKYACEAALEAAKDFLDSIAVYKSSSGQDRSSEDFECRCDCDELHRILCADDQEDTVIQLCKNILVRWNEKVRADYENNPFSEEEVKNVSEKYRGKYLSGEKQEHAYGATLQLAILTKHYFLAIRNGDGECVTIDSEGRFYTPIPDNDSCEANYTTSLCDSAAIEDFRYILIFESDPTFPLAVYLGSDGVDNSYTNKEELFSLYRNITRKAIKSGIDEMISDVTHALQVLTNRGSGDDVSVAGILNLTELPHITYILEADAEVRRKAIEAQRETKKRAQKERERISLTKRLNSLSEEYKKLQEEISSFNRRSLLRFGFQKVSEYELLRQRQQALCEEIEAVCLSLAEIKGIDSEHLLELVSKMKSVFAASSPERVIAVAEDEFDTESSDERTASIVGPTVNQENEQQKEQVEDKIAKITRELIDDETSIDDEDSEHE